MSPTNKMRLLHSPQCISDYRRTIVDKIWNWINLHNFSGFLVQQRSPSGILCRAYLIFVIFFTQTRFLENKIYTEERVNYDKRISRQDSVNQDLLGQANNKDQDHEKKGNYTLCVKAVYHWMGVKTTYSVKITHIV